MGEPAVENTSTISESLDEINRQMEELNIPADAPADTPEATSTASRHTGSDSADPDTSAGQEDLSLNTERPPDSESLQKMASEDITQDPVGQAEEEAGQETAPEPSAGPRAAMEDEETGIDLGDDELWEDDDIEEIPLFEEEFLEQELESETESAVPENDQPPEKQDARQASKEEAGQPSGEEAIEEDEKTPQDPREEKAAEAPDMGPEGIEETEASAEPEKGDSKGQLQEKSEAQTVEDEGGLRALIPWIVTGLSAGLCVAAIFTIWLIASSADTKTANKLQPSAEIPEETVQPPVKSSPKTPTRPARGIAQAIDLAPFLIPAQRAGDLVFFKLRVELIAPDATTKQEILKREAWVRDIIYQELKGINISRGIKGDILTRYRRPLHE